MMHASGAWSVPAYYNDQKNIRLMAEKLAREKRALGPGTMMLPTLTPMGATAFSGGLLRSEGNFDVLMQCFANGASLAPCCCCY